MITEYKKRKDRIKAVLISMENWDEICDFLSVPSGSKMRALSNVLGIRDSSFVVSYAGCRLQIGHYLICNANNQFETMPSEAFLSVYEPD